MNKETRSDGSRLVIALSLGHNSSAIGVVNGKIIAAYEQERFTREKSSSKFAESAIDKIISLYQPNPKEENLFLISHWYDDFNFTKEFHEKINKHFNYSKIESYIEKYNFKLISLSDNFTHHDAHAYSTHQFFLRSSTKEQYQKFVNENSFIFVFDGFGNKEEVASIYKCDRDNNINLLNRFYGYENSLGLMYQYATSFVGMKENEDEYKFLGYESKISKYIDSPIAIKYIEDKANEYAKNWFNSFVENSNPKQKPDKKYIDVDHLMNVKAAWHNRFSEIIKHLSENHNLKIDDNVEVKRSIIGNYIQTIIESIHIQLISFFKVQNIMASGGLYYNVKLNNRILKEVPGMICVAPLAGDQGAAIGLYTKYVGDFPYYDLTWGERVLSSTEVEIQQEVIKNVEFIDTKEELVEKAFNYLKNNEIVQVVTGDMEFGPRALCNTSTLSIAYSENVDVINSINGRNTVMPFAPVTIPEMAKKLFDNDQLERIVGSLGYMIITVDYKQEVMNNQEAYKLYRGVANPYPFGNKYSGRPQVVQDKSSYIYQLIDKLYRELGICAIINTSLNRHGKPIVFNAQDAVDDLLFNVEKAKEKNIDSSKIHLLVYNEKK